MQISVEIPGPPLALERARATVVNGRARIYDAPKSRQWKSVAQDHMAVALHQQGIGKGPWPAGTPLSVRIRAYFLCPRSEYRKTSPRERRPHVKARGDIDNIVKAVLDAGNSVLWLDDCQIWRVDASKLIGGQEEPARVTLIVSDEAY